MNAASAYYHRPFQSSSSSSTPNKNEKEGRTLLDLLRSRDKLIGKHDDDDDDDDDETDILQLEHELISRLSSLNASVRRCGLFTNAERAQSYYKNASDRSSSAASDRTAADNGAEGGGGGGGTGSSKKRKRKKGGAGGTGNKSTGNGPSANSYGIYLDSHSNESFPGISSGEKCDLDEGLVLTAICRILGVTVGRKKKDGSDKVRGGASSYGLMCAALNVLSSLCDHAKDGMVPSLVVGDSTCASIEGDMVGSVGSPLLEALCDNILYSYYKNDDEMVKGLMGCFKACASVVSLLETRLSRADKTLQSLRDSTWLVLNNLNGLSAKQEELVTVQKAATVLLSTLALAGNSDGTPPAKLWSQSVTDGITLLRWAIHGFFPMPTDDGPNMNAEAKQHPTLWKDHESWTSIAKDVSAMDNEEVDLGNDPTDNHRSQALKSRIQCLTGYIHSLVKMENYPLHRLNNLSSSTLSLPFDSLLDTSEILLSFPLAAEARFRSTKPRLRSTPVADGLLSPNAAMEISAEVRSCGHVLLDGTVNSCRGGSGALGKARRLVGMSVANLQSSCSTALVSVVVDGGRRGSSNMGSWIRGSIPLRIKSIQTFHSVAISLGSGSMASGGTAKSMCRALVLLGGCLLEQVVGGEGGDEWGTLGERAKLVETSSTALASCIAAFGGLIPNNIRSTLDSITHTCLSTLYSRGGSSSIFAYSHVKRSILQLGMNCACVPWGDGGCSSSTITEIVRTVSNMLRNDADVSVASMALSTLCALDAFRTPRAPPIVIPTRGSVDETTNYGSSGVTASALVQGMNESKMEMMASKEAKEEQRVASSKKADKKSTKRAKKKKDETPTKVKEAPVATNKSEDKKASGSNSGNIDSKKTNFNFRTTAAKESKKSTVVDNTGKTGSARGEPQNAKSDNGSGEIMAAALTADEDDVEMKEEKDDDDDANSDDDDNSLDDFPDIIDEDPDEEDRV